MSVHTIQFTDLSIDDQINLGNTRLEVRQINIIAGQNASGKSLVNKFVWISALAGLTYTTLISLQPDTVDEAFKIEMDNYLRYTFEDHEEISGGVEVVTDVYSIRYYLKEGNVESFNVDVYQPENFKPEILGTPHYNSKECRTFDQFERYKKIKSKITVNGVMGHCEMDELMGFYKLYEMMWFEKVNTHFDNYAGGDTEYLDSRIPHFHNIMGIDSSDWGSIKIIDGTPFIEKKDSLVRLSRLSSGEQSAMMLSLFT